jgi:hypothetical protein
VDVDHAGRQHQAGRVHHLACQTEVVSAVLHRDAGLAQRVAETVGGVDIRDYQINNELRGGGGTRVRPTPFSGRTARSYRLVPEFRDVDAVVPLFRVIPVSAAPRFASAAKPMRPPFTTVPPAARQHEFTGTRFDQPPTAAASPILWSREWTVRQIRQADKGRRWMNNDCRWNAVQVS